ncbi:MAG: hypothetical protein AAFP82_15900, partial [Bacteroidota bacterium]
MRYFILITFLFSFQTIIYSQTNNLTNYQSFFEEQKAAYQTWLEESGFDQVLRVHELAVEKDKLTLYLGFHTENLDTLSSAWQQLKSDFEAKNALSLEQMLYYQLVYFMEVPQEQVYLEIYDSYDTEKYLNARFWVILSFEENKLKINKNTRNKDAKREVYINLKEIKINQGKAEVVKENLTKIAVFKRIVKYARAHYTQKNCEGRKPGVKILEDQNILRFVISDLCREVLE